jgi:hypothetical protein
MCSEAEDSDRPLQKVAARFLAQGPRNEHLMLMKSDSSCMNRDRA